MALKTYKPMTAGQRSLVLVDRSHLWKGKPVKTLTEGLSSKGGRNNHGRMTARRRGGGHKRLYRKVDFKRTKFDVPAKVERIEYDPNRSAFIALIRYEDGELSYILAPQRLGVGDAVIRRTGRREAGQRDAAGEHADRHDRPQCRDAQGQGWPDRPRRWRLCAVGWPRCGLRDSAPQFRRDAHGARGMHGDHVGAVSNPDNSNIKLGKAGRKRWMGKRPAGARRGDEPGRPPHGGGEGRTSGGRHPVTPWGKPTKGKRTRSNKRDQPNHPAQPSPAKKKR